MMLVVATGVVTVALLGAWFVVRKEIQKRKDQDPKTTAASSTVGNGGSHNSPDSTIDRSVR
jgi:predicted permease